MCIMEVDSATNFSFHSKNLSGNAKIALIKAFEYRSPMATLENGVKTGDPASRRIPEKRAGQNI